MEEYEYPFYFEEPEAEEDVTMIDICYYSGQELGSEFKELLLQVLPLLKKLQNEGYNNDDQIEEFVMGIQAGMDECYVDMEVKGVPIAAPSANIEYWEIADELVDFLFRAVHILSKAKDREN